MFAKLTFGLDRTPFGADSLDFAFFLLCEPTHVTQIGQCHFAAVLGRVYVTTCMLLFPVRGTTNKLQWFTGRVLSVSTQPVEWL